MPADPMRAKALACLREGRVSVLRAETDPRRVWAHVKSSRDGYRYRVALQGGKWVCDCRLGLRGEQCAHVAAVALVTTAEAVPA